MTLAVRLVTALAVLVAGLAAGGATVLLHQWWWGLALGLAAGIATLLWLPRGWLRVFLAAGWCTAVARATLTRPEGDYLVPSSDRGWTLLAATVALLVVALLPPRRGGRRAVDQGDQGPPI